MWATRFTVSVLFALSLAMLSSRSLCAGEPPPPSGQPSGEEPEMGPPGPPVPGEPPSRGGRGLLGGFRQRGLETAGPLGPPLGDPTGRPGPLGRPGGSGPRGMRRPFQPSGPPRWPHHSWDALEKNDPEMYKLLEEDFDLERRERELVIQYRQAPPPQRPAVRKELTDLVNEQFVVRQERRLLELKRLEEELDRLRKAIDARNDAREQLVSQRISQLLGEENELDF